MRATICIGAPRPGERARTVRELLLALSEWLALPRQAPGARNIDIAVNGLPQEDFFRAYGQLPMKIDHRFDLVDLSNDAAFSRRLRESGTLEGVG